MKINFTDYDFEGFDVKEGSFCGIPAKLITPDDIKVKFTQKNKIFRSSVWDLDGNLLSAGFPKFVNAGENPEHFPMPESLDDATVIDKIDGSTAIFDYVDGQLNVRTRGKFSKIGLQNEADFDLVITKYPQIQTFLEKKQNHSLIFEITTPNQQICINYGPEPDLWLIGSIYKSDYSLVDQPSLDYIARFWGFKRPAHFTFGSIKDLLTVIKEKKEGEGVCVYSSRDQAIHKVKSARYLMLHRLKSEISCFGKVVDLFLELDKPSAERFYEHIKTHFDYELAELAKPQIEMCCGIWAELEVKLTEIERWVQPLKEKTRKEAASRILDRTKMTAAAFVFLDGRELEKKNIKNLILDLAEKEKNLGITS